MSLESTNNTIQKENESDVILDIPVPTNTPNNEPVSIHPQIPEVDIVSKQETSLNNQIQTQQRFSLPSTKTGTRNDWLKKALEAAKLEEQSKLEEENMRRMEKEKEKELNTSPHPPPLSKEQKTDDATKIETQDREQKTQSQQSDSSNSNDTAPVESFSKCWNCDKVEQKAGEFQRCQKCKQATYCKRDCQIKHWRLEHRSLCQDYETSRQNAQSLLENFKKMKVGAVEEIERVQKKSVEEMAKISAKNDDSQDKRVCWSSECKRDIEDDSKTILTCSGCKTAKYCSAKCKSDHWKFIHSVECKEIWPLILPRSELANYKVDKVSETWGYKMVATKDIKRGQLITVVEPFLQVSQMTRNEILKNESKSASMQALFGERSDDVITGAKKPKEQNEKDLIPRIRLYDDEFTFGKDFPCVSMRSRLAFLLLKFHWAWVWGSLFELGLMGEDQEHEEVQKLYKYVSNNKNFHMRGLAGKDQEKEKEKLITIDIVTSAYTMARQAEIVILEHTIQDDLLSLSFTPLLAMMNHSCNANSILWFSKGWFYVFASRDIKSGEQIFRDYVPNNNSDLKYFFDRRDALLASNHFVCKCMRCAIEQLDPSIPKYNSRESADRLYETSRKEVEERRKVFETKYPVKSRTPKEAKIWEDSENIHRESLLKKIRQLVPTPFNNTNTLPEIGDKMMMLRPDSIGSPIDPKYGIKQKEFLLSIQNDLSLKDYLFKQDWPLFLALVHDVVKYEIRRHFIPPEIQPDNSSSSSQTTIQTEFESRFQKVVPDEVDKANSEKSPIREQYLNIIDMFLKYLDESEAVVDLTKGVVRRATFFHWIRYCLLMLPHMSFFLQVYGTTMKEFVKLAESNEKNLENTKDERMLEFRRNFHTKHWLVNGFAKIPDQDRTKILESVEWLNSNYYVFIEENGSHHPMGFVFTDTIVALRPDVYYGFSFFSSFISFFLNSTKAMNAAMKNDKEANTDARREEDNNKQQKQEEAVAVEKESINKTSQKEEGEIRQQ